MKINPRFEAGDKIYKKNHTGIPELDYFEIIEVISPFFYIIFNIAIDNKSMSIEWIDFEYNLKLRSLLKKL